MESSVVNKLLIKKILEHPNQHNWTYQGLGMLRLNLSEEIRLHIWDPFLAIPNVTDIHTHPWDFKSTVISGKVYDTQFRKEILVPEKGSEQDLYQEQEIICGPGGCATATPKEVYLRVESTLTYTEGESYSHLAENIHKSQPTYGAVTIVERRFRVNRDVAYVYFPKGKKWVSAESRKAEDWEIKEICNNALDKWV